MDLINVRAGEYPKSVQQEQGQVKSAIRSRHQELIAKETEDVKGRITGGQWNGVEQASERGASTWLMAIPLAKYGIGLNKQAFRDAICLRYGWTLERLRNVPGISHSSSVNARKNGVHFRRSGNPCGALLGRNESFSAYLLVTLTVRRAVIRPSFASIADTLREEFANKGLRLYEKHSYSSREARRRRASLLRRFFDSGPSTAL